MNSSFGKQAGNRQQGAALVEFAVILPVLVMLAFGITELGRLLFHNTMLNKAAAVGARYVARVPDAVTPDCGQGGEWGDATTEGENLIAYTDAGDGSLMLSGLDDSGAITFSIISRTVNSTTVCVVNVAVVTPFDGLFGDSIVPLLDLGPINLRATVEERYIGE